MVTHIQTRVQSNEDSVLLVNAQRDIHICLIVQHVGLPISDKKRALEVLYPDGCCNIVGGLIPAIWEKHVVWDFCPGVGSVTAAHNNYLVVTAFESQGEEEVLFLVNKYSASSVIRTGSIIRHLDYPIAKFHKPHPYLQKECYGSRRLTTVAKTLKENVRTWAWKKDA